ncbi:MAG: hypothetical protein FJW20_24645 [Acidimicrobiia bacterium]|nr:hypothetical protein [Acidimicrobiia bacterium]
MPQNNRRTGLAALVILCFSAFLFSRTTGDLQVWGDDIFFIDHPGTVGSQYPAAMAARGFLPLFYHTVYELMGRDTHLTHLFYIFLLIASGLLFYLVMSRFLDSRGSLIAALLYLAYSGKYETITWISAGAYLIIAIVLLSSVLIAVQWDHRPWPAALAIAAINWLAVHLYEVLIVVAPLYPALVWVHYRWNRQRLPPSRLLASCMPLGMFLVHWTLLYSFASDDGPIWMRNQAMKSDPASMLPGMINAFQLGIHASFGSDHLMRMKWVLWDFLFMAGSWWMLASFLITAMVFYLFWRRTKEERLKPPARVKWLLFAGAAYLVLFSPVVAFTTVENVMFSRLLTLPGMGLAALAGLVVTATANRMAGWFASAALLLVITLEGVALNTYLWVDQSNWRYDSHVLSQLRQMRLKLEEGDAVLLSHPPFHPAWGYTRKGTTILENIAFQYQLLVDNGLLRLPSTSALIDRVKYYPESRDQGIESPRLDLAEEWLDRPERVIALVIRQRDLKLMAVERAEYVDAEGRLLRTVEFPRVAHLAADRKMVARIRR